MKLQAENITKLCNGKKVLDQLQLTLEKGKIYGLTGRIGVGKTTLFSILSKQLLRTPEPSIYMMTTAGNWT